MKQHQISTNIVKVTGKHFTLLLFFLFIFTSSNAQTLYEKNVQLGTMFQESGNPYLAERYFQTAINNTDNQEEKLKAQLGLISVMKLWRPVEAQRMNEQCAEATRNNPSLRQEFLAMNAFIYFSLDNKGEFEKAYQEYASLCQQHDSLPSTYDQALKAMYEATEGFYDQALQTLAGGNISKLDRHNLRIHIFEKTGNTQQLLQELRNRAVTIDSLEAAMYDQNLHEADVAVSMTRQQQQAERHSSQLMLLIYALLAIIVIMILIWVLLYRIAQKNHKKKDEQLRMALKMASETDEMKQEFIRRINHEIRTPLNAIIGFNDILNNSEIEVGQEERAELMAQINENAKAIISIADELLQVANNESVVEYSKNDTVLCNQFFSDLLYKHRLEVHSNVELIYTTKVVNRFTVLINAKEVQTIVDHLINNAIKFTQRGTIELNCREEDNMLYLSVSDTGCGIPADKQDAIFEQFAKVDANKQGIGLGLTVSRNVARKLGGDLILDKDYNFGARFILSIPVK